MSKKGNIRVAEEYMEALNQHDLARMRAYHGEGFQFMGPGLSEPVDENGNEAYLQQRFTAFPDLTFRPTQTIADGDYVVQNWIATGTHNGPMTMRDGTTLPPSGKKATVLGSNTVEFKKGKMVRSTVYFDVMSLMAQLGVGPGA